MDKTGECICINDIFEYFFDVNVNIGDKFSYIYNSDPVDCDGLYLSNYTVYNEICEFNVSVSEFSRNFVDLKVIREEKINKII